MEIRRPHRSRSGTKALVAALALVVAAAAATAAIAASAPKLKLTVSPVATIGGAKSTLTVRGSVSCTSPSFLALSVIAIEPADGAAVHGSFPLPGGRAPECKPPKKSFKIVANQQGEKKPLALAGSKVRVCFIIRSWWRRSAFSLDAHCQTLRASH